MSRIGRRIFVTMALVALVSLAISGWITRGATRAGLTKFLALEDSLVAEAGPDPTGALAQDLGRIWDARTGGGKIEDALGRFVASSERFTGVALFDREADLITGIGLPSATFDASITGHGIEVVWRFEGDETLRLRGGTPVLDASGSPLATLMPIVALPIPSKQERQRAVLGTIDRRILLALALVGGLALVAAAFLTRRIASPIEHLAGAARDLGRGDLSRRVVVSGNDELAALAGAFNEMAAAWQRAETLRQRMVTDVAHELRSPLSGLLGQVEALQDGLLEPTDDVLAALRDDIGHLGSLVTDLQDLALADAGQLRLDTCAVGLDGAIRSACRTLGLGKRSRPRLHLEIETDLEIEADPRRLRQILLNLLGNARTHAPDGTVTVECRTRNKAVEIVVADDGPGIDASRLGDLFERFYRTDASRTRGTGGTGLGLAIVKELAELHGGSVHAASSPGRGARFTVRLPTG